MKIEFYFFLSINRLGTYIEKGYRTVILIEMKIDEIQERILVRESRCNYLTKPSVCSTFVYCTKLMKHIENQRSFPVKLQ